MELDQNTLIALAILGGALLFVLLYRPKPAVPAPAPEPAPAPCPPIKAYSEIPPGRALIDAFEESGKDGAGHIIEDRLGQQKAAEIMASLGAAFGGAAAPSNPTGPPAAT